MLQNIKGILNPKNKDLQKRILFTLFVGFVFLLGKNISVPGTKPIVSQSEGVLDLLNLMSGNALQQVSIFALGVMPYITASIIIQLLSMDVLPVLTRLSEEGEVGKRKINKITRYFAIVLSLIQGLAYAITFDNSYNILLESNAISYVVTMLSLTAGTAFLLWLGDQVTNRGVGNGISFIIMIGIVSGLPSMFEQAFDALYQSGSSQEQLLSLGKFAGFVLLYIAIVVLIIIIQDGIRRVAVQYSNRTSSAYGGLGRNFIPFSINSAGVIPVIFAGAILTAPVVFLTIGSYFTDTTSSADWVNKYLSLQSKTGFALYIVLIFTFTYFYTFIQVDPNKVAENLQQSGGYVPGVRPGDETSKYFYRVLTRLTFFGALFISFIAGIPILFSWWTNMPSTVTLGGTAILIVVGVSLEIVKQIEQQLVGNDYEGYVTK